MLNVRIDPTDCPISDYEKGITQGLWLAELRVEEIEAERGRKSIIAQKLAAYRMGRQLQKETGYNISESA